MNSDYIKAANIVIADAKEFAKAASGSTKDQLGLAHSITMLHGAYVLEKVYKASDFTTTGFDKAYIYYKKMLAYVTQNKTKYGTQLTRWIMTIVDGIMAEAKKRVDVILAKRAAETAAEMLRKIAKTLEDLLDLEDWISKRNSIESYIKVLQSTIPELISKHGSLISSHSKMIYAKKVLARAIKQLEDWDDSEDGKALVVSKQVESIANNLLSLLEGSDFIKNRAAIEKLITQIPALIKKYTALYGDRLDEDRISAAQQAVKKAIQALKDYDDA